jgi:signal transduction histidine kinase
MAEVSIGQVSFKGGKVFGILIALSTLVGGLYGGFEVYKDYMDMKEKIQNYTAPDLSHIEQEIAVVKSEVDMVLEEIYMKADLRQMNNDIRHITEIVNDVEDRQKEDSRELISEMKILEENLDLKINKALNNPLNNMSANIK